ncbi:MAG: CotH kinase family protein [Bacteroidota bacterium]
MRVFVPRSAFLLFFLLPLIGQAQVVINEYTCSNLNLHLDEYGNYEDWIELYNMGDQVVDLGGYYLTDNPEILDKYQIPSGITIEPGGYSLFYPDGRGLNNHPNFKLTQTKNNPESIVLSDPGLNVVDGITLIKTQLSHTIGREIDGIGEWRVFTNDSPGETNNANTTFIRYAERPDMDVDAGHHSGSVTVSIINNEPNSTVHYTTDGTRPSILSPVYNGPITVSETAVIKAYAISQEPNVLPSFLVFNTYLINEEHSLPVISIAGTALDILANGNLNIEPKGSVEIFSLEGERVARATGEFNKHGQASWANNQRSLDIVCRDEMGVRGKLREKIFDLSERDQFQRLILRAAGDDNYPDGSNWPGGGANIRDAYLDNMCIIGGMNVDTRITEKYILYLNGEYWGVYDLREKPADSDFTKEYYNSGKYDVQYLLTWGNTWAQYGGQQALDDWQEFHDWVLANDMTEPANFEYATSVYDWTSLVDYVIANSVSVCVDWLNWNCGWWRGTNPETMAPAYRFILWDNDATWGYHYNYTGILFDEPDAPPCQVDDLPNILDPWGNDDPDVNGHVEILNHLRQNPIADQYYISRYVDLRNTVFSCDNMLSYLDVVLDLIEPEMPRHIERWGGSMEEWLDNVDDMRQFIIQRCDAFSEGMVDCYDLSGPYDITFTANPTEAAILKVNSLTIEELPYTGEYFGGIDVLVDAASVSEDYEFVEWTSDVSQVFTAPEADSTSIQVEAENTVTAHFNFTLDIEEAQSKNDKIKAQPTIFNDFTTIHYTIARNSEVKLNLFAESGVQVAQLVNISNQAPGSFELRVDFENINLSSGMYFLQVVIDGEPSTIKLMYTR